MIENGCQMVRFLNTIPKPGWPSFQMVEKFDYTILLFKKVIKMVWTSSTV
jgi:hypothetical protein